MKFIVYIPMFFLFYVCSCTPGKVARTCQKTSDYQQISYELENSLTASNTISDQSSLRTTAAVPSLEEVREFALPESCATCVKQQSFQVATLLPIPEQESKVNVKHPRLESYKPDKLSGSGPFHFEKKNTFWKIGKTLMKVGVTSLALFGGVFLSISTNARSGYFFLSGFLISLAIIVLSLPFFLLGMIVEIMQRRSSSEIINPTEI